MNTNSHKQYGMRYVLKRSLVLMMMCGLASCSNFLDEAPISNSSDGNDWNTEDEGNAAVAGCYSLLRQGMNNGLAHFSHGDLPTDEFSLDQSLGGEDYNSVQTVDWGISVPTTSTYRVMMRLRRFDYFYSAINQANLCLQHLPGIPKEEFEDYETTFNQFIGEAYFVRAFAYFYMARIWGDVPIVSDENPDETDLTNYSRDAEAEVVAKAIEDVTTAISYLPWDLTNTDDQAVRANKGAAMALLAHLYAWQGDYASCETTADAILNEGYYSYVSRNNYLNIFIGQSSEGIFEIAQNSDDEANSAVAYTGLGSYLLKTPYLTTQLDNSLWPLDATTLLSTFFTDADNDLRAINGFDFLDTSNPICIKYSNITYTSETSPLLLNNIIVFRLSDIALLSAEAKAAQQKYTAARTLLDEIRALANLGASGAEDDALFEEIIEERGRELFMEGHRFYDLVRLAKEKQVYLFGRDANKISASEFAAGKYHWPLDPVLILNNHGYTQTPYWASKME